LVREVEATLLGYLEAVRAAGQRQGLVTTEGVLAPVIEAEVEAGTGSSTEAMG
jgi:hypothetical protein